MIGCLQKRRTVIGLELSPESRETFSGEPCILCWFFNVIFFLVDSDIGFNNETAGYLDSSSGIIQHRPRPGQNGK